MFENLTLDDLATESSNGEDSESTLDTEEQGILKWRQKMMAANRSSPRVRGYRGRYRPLGAQRNINMTSRVPGQQPDGGCDQQRIQVAAQVSKGREPCDSKDPNTVEEATDECQLTLVEGSRRKIEERLAHVDFKKITKTNRPGWREFCREHDPEVTAAEMDVCQCYGFNQKCWAESEERWIPHIQHCKECEQWMNTKCTVKGHSPKSKCSILSDLGNRRYLASYPVKDNNTGKTCCDRKLCTHEFYEHCEMDIPWWACIEEDCEEHQKMKIRNQQWPRLPRSSILKAQECPCFRNGCLCNFSELHLYRNNLLIPPGKSEVLENLKETREVWETIKAESQKTLRELEQNIMRLRMVNTEEPEVKQIDINVKVGNESITAVVDCGANVDYVNEAWCKEKKFPITDIGKGWMEGFDGKQTKVKLQEAEVKFRFQGKFQRQKFRIIKETGTDLLVLGMPWLQKINPEVDWQKRTVTLRKPASKEPRRKIETPAVQRKIVKKLNTGINQEIKPTEGRRGGYGGDQACKEKSKETDYQQRLADTRDKLPDEIKDYAEVFCQKE
jgi:hypothetical protein